MKVVIINGYLAADKDIFTEMCKEVVPVKQIWIPPRQAHSMINWNEKKTLEARDELAELKEQVSRYSNRAGIFFIHTKEPQKIAYYKKEFNAFTVCIVRKPKENLNHKDIRQKVDFDYDFYIDNIGSLDNLRKWAHMFAELIGSAERFQK